MKAATIKPSVTPFESELFKRIAAYIRQARTNGTVSMSAANLLQCVRPPSESLEGAPRGTNARYFYAETFRAVCARGVRESSNFQNFITP